MMTAYSTRSTNNGQTPQQKQHPQANSNPKQNAKISFQSHLVLNQFHSNDSPNSDELEKDLQKQFLSFQQIDELVSKQGTFFLKLYSSYRRIIQSN